MVKYNAEENEYSNVQQATSQAFVTAIDHLMAQVRRLIVDYISQL